MGKRKSKKGKRNLKGAPEKTTSEGAAIPAEEREDRLDFGGLPDRDLKKNLGCG